MRRINPKLTTRESISQWLQQWVDELMEDCASDHSLPPCSYTKEKMMAICNQRMEDIIFGRATTISHEEVIRRMSEILSLSVRERECP